MGQLLKLPRVPSPKEPPTTSDSVGVTTTLTGEEIVPPTTETDEALTKADGSTPRTDGLKRRQRKQTDRLNL